MSTTSPASANDLEAIAPSHARVGVLRDLVNLTKPRLSLLAAMISAAGYYVAGAGGNVPLTPSGLAHAFFATLMVSGGAMTLNMMMERDLDARMERTRNRPVAAGRISPTFALVQGVLMSVGGMVWLWQACTLAAAVTGALAVLLYVLVYTPMKPLSNMCTIVGAIPGALPPVIGYTAATGVFDFDAAVLFAIMFLWQMPHFLAIAWLCREDYARAGMPMLSVIDREGLVTARQVLIYSVALIPVTILPTLIGMTGWAYAVLSTLAGLWFIRQALRWMGSRHNRTEARKLFALSLVQITIIFLLMVIDRA
jgi:protoheme IX farnesyltransferase